MGQKKYSPVIEDMSDMHVMLNETEMEALFRQDPAKRADGGYQSLLVGLQDNCDRATGAITVTAKQRARIKMYAFRYGKGGWEDQLTTAFSRHLGPNLDREE
ncbi:MAG: hypothetical protein WDN49_03355 [Acetobacteraceae bacterium]